MRRGGVSLTPEHTHTHTPGWKVCVYVFGACYATRLVHMGVVHRPRMERRSPHAW
jgi:hypothetical protein